jgi:KipI family sensor histidine kinase inhibitor
VTGPFARIRPVADGSLLVEYPEASDEEANRAAVVLGAALRASSLPGLLDAIAGARTLFCAFLPERIGGEELARAIDSKLEGGFAVREPKEHRIPVLYGGAGGPDLPELARRAGVPPDELAARHAARRYRVAFLGFAPGFGYLSPLASGPESELVAGGLDAERRPTPRPRVPGGSLALAGGYTGIYPADGPGGWNLVGLAAARLFDPGSAAPALFSPGDEVRFEPQSPAQFERARATIPNATPLPPLAGVPVFRTVKAGLSSVLCGAPIHGRGSQGVAPGGAMDSSALGFGNRILGNPADAVALELSLAGPGLEALEDCRIAIAGAPCIATLDGRAIDSATSIRISKGSHLSLGPVREGVRSYLCLAGGFSVSAAPGIPPRISEGEILFAAAGARVPASSIPSPGARAPQRFRPSPQRFRPASATADVRIVLGPQEDRFAAEAVGTLLASDYRVSSTSDRRGIRLEGPALSHRDGADIAPEATALGAIQVPADGQPIVLGPDRPVTGGYAKIATVIGADFPVMAQARPGSRVRFRAVPLEEAVEARGEARSARWEG